MNTIIAGSRHLPVNVDDIEAAVRESQFPIPTTLSGHSGNVDLAAEQWAESKGIPCTLFPADWKRYGRAAGPKRNKAMAQAADALLALYDGKSKGTANMIEEAKNAGLKVSVQSYEKVLTSRTG